MGKTSSGNQNPRRNVPGPGRGGRSLNAYHSITQFRADHWKALNDDTSALAETAAQGVDHEELKRHVAEGLALLEPIDSYWAFPSNRDFEHFFQLFEEERFQDLSRVIARASRAISSLNYRHKAIALESEEALEDEDWKQMLTQRYRMEGIEAAAKPYFEVLVVDDISPEDQEVLKAGLHRLRKADDPFVFEIVVVPSFEDAIIAVLFNYNIQACIIRYDFPFKSKYQLELLQQMLEDVNSGESKGIPKSEYGLALGAKIAELRPEIDLYLVTDAPVEDLAGKVGKHFRRVFYREEDSLELHFSIMRGVQSRYKSPFFTALKEYSKQPTGVFHALPISRGKSILKSNWIQDMLRFYGNNIFLAETSATSGGLDSLLEPTGPLKEAQQLAARAFGARQTFFVTNGTSTGNKIVTQALLEPGDIVLVDRNCHKSHHYGMVQAGAMVDYLDAYPLQDFTMYGAVPLRHIKAKLLGYRRAGLLDRVKMMTLTNCTFDGMIYDVERVMEECLAIKPDLVFLWDEAWFAYAYFHPTYRRRTGMSAATRLRARFRSEQYQMRYNIFRKALEQADRNDDSFFLDNRLVPDPEKVRVRVYATQSTHKRLTALRQGSMIHIHDQDFKQKIESPFHEAYMTHTSTSPNYQILASLDVGRRQMELEGFELVQRQTDLALTLREKIKSNPLISKYFNFLSLAHLIPAEYRPSGIKHYFILEHGYSRMETAWREDEFVLEPSHLTLNIGRTGIDGDTFKHDYLMAKHGIQVNKTTRNTLLIMTNIGTTRSSVAYLIEVLLEIARELDQEIDDMSPLERRSHQRKVESLSNENPPLPDFSGFHDFFRLDPGGRTAAGDLRTAYFMAYKEELCEYLKLSGLRRQIASGRQVVSAMFVIPYPPGFPVLVPGQVISEEIMAFMKALDTREIHGLDPEFGFRVFTEAALSPPRTAEEKPAEPTPTEQPADVSAAAAEAG